MMVVRLVVDEHMRPVRRRLFVRTMPGSKNEIKRWLRPKEFGQLLAAAPDA
jgi:hypothetical protein